MISTRIKVLPLTAATLILFSQTTAAIAAPTWMPTYDPDKAVYVDPALSGHPVAPYQFSSKLETQLSQESKEGLRYFVVAAQQGDESAPSDKPLGVAKVDELLPTWTNRPGFPKENYVVIFWVRKRENFNKGSVGVNAGKVGREAGVMPDVLSSPNGLVIPALKANMPADPEGAMIDIVANIEDQVAAHREILAQQQKDAERERIAQAKQKEQERVAAQQREQFHQNLQSWFRAIVNALPFVGGIGGVGLFFIIRRRRQATAQSLIEEWSALCQNTSSLYLEVEGNELPKLQTLPLDADAMLKSKFEGLVSSLAEFMAWSTVASELASQANALLDKGKARPAIYTLTKETVTIENSKVPVMLANLQEGIDVVQTLTATELKQSLNEKWQSIQTALSELSSIQQSYLELSKDGAFTTLMRRPEQLLDEHSPELNRYDLSQGSFLDSSHGFEELVSEYEQLIQQSEIELKSSQIVNAVETQHKAADILDRLVTQVQQALIDKRKCEEVTDHSFSGKELEDKIIQASTALEQVQTYFPHEPRQTYQSRVEQAIEVKDKQLPQHQAQFIQAYQQKHFRDALRLLQQAQTLKNDWMTTLAGVIDYPARLEEKKRMLQRKLESIQRKNQALRSRYQVRIGTPAWSSTSLDALSNSIHALESSVSSAETQQRRDSASSSSSWSSGSSWGSSGGSDFGGSSGGSDYGSSSGGGDY